MDNKVKNPVDMTPEELEAWRETHDPNSMGFNGPEGVDEDDESN